MSKEQSEPATSHLYVTGLADTVTEAALRAAFIPYGELTDVHIARPRSSESGGSRFAFLSFEDPDDAFQARLNLHNADFHGRTLRVTNARSAKREVRARAVWELEDEENEKKREEQ